jgi:hypothetical protein
LFVALEFKKNIDHQDVELAFACINLEVVELLLEEGEEGEEGEEKEEEEEQEQRTRSGLGAVAEAATVGVGMIGGRRQDVKKKKVSMTRMHACDLL